MLIKEPRNISYVISISFHILLAIIFLFIKMSTDSPAEDYLLVGFGSGSGLGNPSSIGTTKTIDENKTTPEKSVDKKDKLKKVDLPKANQTDENNVVVKNDKKKENSEIATSEIKPLVKGDNKKTGSEIGGEGDGGFGFELDFGGKGVRRIYSYNLPEYPEGVAKEIDVKLRFTILPDGTVSRIVPLIKADARLEFVAINSLKQWRFEPLPSNAKQVEQTVVIIFPYRLL
ncbi:MAG: energy transducer TonB [Ignavibacteriales bacterium]|nr:energy transducer TonB [Ignavibacteriales bacterium]